MALAFAPIGSWFEPIAGAEPGNVAVSHPDARQRLARRFAAIFGRAPTLNEAQTAQAVFLLETGYGQRWTDAGRGSNNWGAIQRSRVEPGEQCPPDGFLYTDSFPTNRPGVSVPYRVCFRRYDSPDAGAEHALRVLYRDRPSVLRAAASGNLRAVAAAMYDTTYYQGRGADRAARIEGYAKGLDGAVATIARSLGEPRAMTLHALGLATTPTAGAEVAAVGLFLWGLVYAALRARESHRKARAF